MTVLERLSESLKMAFHKKNIYKKADMAKYLGYANSYFSEITNGKENLSDSFLKNISEKLGVNTNWVITGEGEMLKAESMNEQRADSPIVLPSIETKRLIELGAEAFEKKLLDMFQKGEIYSAATVKEKDLLIHELLIKVGKLEAKVEELEKEKGNVRTDENATCANVG